MNKQGKGKIEWTDQTWIPVHGCTGNPESECYDYCYGKENDDRFHRSYAPKFYPERLKEPYNLKAPSKIFVCSVSDFWAPFFKHEWREQIGFAMAMAHWHTYQLLTKWPENIYDVEFSDNIWQGTTITRDSELHRLDDLLKKKVAVKFLSFEPLLEAIYPTSLRGIDQIIIGARTGRKRFQPDMEWVRTLINVARRDGCKIFLKSKLKRPENWPRIQEFPDVVEKNVRV